jgi:hypothetical protein
MAAMEKDPDSHLRSAKTDSISFPGAVETLLLVFSEGTSELLSAGLRAIAARHGKTCSRRLV